jgi:ribosomal protein S18 acetylase RimI-like enzyme
MTINELKIRGIDENDLDHIVEIDRKILGKKRPEYWKRKIGSPSFSPRPSLVAEKDGKVIGFILGYVSGFEFGIPDNVGWIDTIGIDPDYQRKGIAKELLTQFINNLKKSGKEITPEAETSEIEGVNMIYTLVDWEDWGLIEFFHDMGFKKGSLLNLELKI